MQFLNKYLFKFSLPILFCIAAIGRLSAQTNDPNYLQTRVPRTKIQTDANLDALTGNKESVMRTMAYFDGLGRPMQTVQVQGSPDGLKDIVQPIEYDQYGKESKKYVPFAYTGTSNGSYRADAISKQGLFYYPAGSTALSGSQQSNGVVYNKQPYSQTVFEASPLNRVLEQGAPGEVWQPAASRTNAAGRTVVMDYTTNDQSTFSTATSSNAGSRRVAVYTVSSTGALTRGSTPFYNSNQLLVTIIKDENWTAADGCFGTTEEYKDKEGRVILKRTYNLKAGTTVTAEMLSTYYVYDDLGNLAFVLPPKSGPDLATGVPVETTVDNLCYQYKYDERNRLIRKRVPGKDWEYMVYNKLDQLVLSQDGVQRLGNQWTVNKYDAMGRVVMSGLWNAATLISQSTLQASIYAGVQWDIRDNNNATTGYSITSYPAISTILTINYYDDYAGIPDKPVDYLPSKYSTKTRGLLTASKAAILNSPATMLMTVNYYDDKGRLSTAYVQHYKNGVYNAANYDEINNTYNFNDQVTATTRKHYTYVSGQANPAPALTIGNRYTYDHMGRKTETYQQTGIETSPEVLLSKLDYNELGQLYTKRLHGINQGDAGIVADITLSTADAVTSGQKIVLASNSITLSPGFFVSTGANFQASIVSYLQTITYQYNERGWLSKINEPTEPTAAKVFGIELIYNSTGDLSQYNGNISQINWQTKVPAGVISDPGAQNYAYTYDKLNRLTWANYVKPGAVGKFDEELGYDQNGNIETLKRRNTTSPATYLNQMGYTYNNSGLGNQLMSVTDAGTAAQAGSYTYDLNGNNQTDIRNQITGITYNILNLPQSVVRTPGTITYYYDATGRKLRKVSGGISWDYIGGIEYNNNVIEFVATEEGRAIPSAGVYSYDYYLKDHLGNTRATVKQDGSITQVQDYYAFGMEMAPGNTYMPSPDNRYKYNGKEKQDETGQYDYGARFYDPVIARWTGVDPLAEKSRRFSPYVYGDDNSIRNIDPDGMETQDCCGSFPMKREQTSRNSTYVAPIKMSHKAPNDSEKAFPTTNENLTLGVSLSAGYKGFSQQLGKQERVVGQADQKERPDIKVVDNTTSILIFGGGTKTSTQTTFKPMDIYDGKGNIVGHNIPIRTDITEKIMSMTIGPFSMESREVYKNGVREVYQGRYGFEQSWGKKYGKKNYSIGVDAGAGLKTDWIDVK